MLESLNQVKPSPEADWILNKRILARSPGGLQVPMITIESKQNKIKKYLPDKLKTEDTKLKVIFIIARTHSHDAISSYWCEGIINYLISDREFAAKLRKRFIFKIIPMMCVDGVLIGNTFSNICGIDMHSNWKNTLYIKNPVVYELKKYMRKLQS